MVRLTRCQVIGTADTLRSVVRPDHSTSPPGAISGSRREQGGEGDLGLHAGQVGAEAGVHAAAELQVGVGVGAVEAGARRRRRRSASGRGWRRRWRRRSRRPAAICTVRPHLKAVGSSAIRRTNWFGPSKRRNSWTAAGTSEGAAWSAASWSGRARRWAIAVADQGGGRLVAGDVEGDEVDDELVTGEPDAIDLGGEQELERMSSSAGCRFALGQPPR